MRNRESATYLDTWLNSLNSLKDHLKFSLNTDERSIAVLDTEVYFNESNLIQVH